MRVFSATRYLRLVVFRCASQLEALKAREAEVSTSMTVCDGSSMASSHSYTSVKRGMPRDSLLAKKEKSEKIRFLCWSRSVLTNFHEWRERRSRNR